MITTTRPDLLASKGITSKSLTIPLEDPEFFGDENKYIVSSRGEKYYAGNCLSDEICAWFSAAVEKDVFALRARRDRSITLDKNRLITCRDTDKRMNYVFESALHIVNKGSVQDLKSRVLAKYSDEFDDSVVCME